MDDSIDYIKNLLSSMDDGRISVSPYDTAWIALIKDLNWRNIPQFPSSLEWISNNQLSDGSWGDEHFFLAYDRLLNTLACVVAMRFWNVHADKSKKGIWFIKENISKLGHSNIEHMTGGFELVFPALLQRAKELEIAGIPYDAPVIQEICAVRDQKMESLEGLENLDWQKLLKLQAVDGSFLTSPSSTAFAFMETKDEKCFEFIKNTVEKFNGGAPHAYPVDVFGRLWAIDRLQRLGISRFFESEIKDCLSYIYSVWTNKGVFSRRDSEFCDIDDTSMGFRLLRLQGYDVDPRLENLDWQKLLKLQAVDGSFLTSPSSTAFAFMETKDEKCFEFIKNTVEKFNGGAPHAYPVDVFGRLWAIDRLQRLGISRFFESEIKDCLSYIYSVWTNKGVFSRRDSEFCDIDDTSMGFRLLRLQGYDVDPNVFRNFKNDNKFSCFGGQIIESSSPIYNLYRASQIRFPGEKILEEAEQFAYNFLQEKLESNQVLDKWVISKHLPDEIRIGLEVPWYSSLPRVLTRFYLEHYGAADDVWIGKVLYRMPDINNDTYMELARLDYNRCQTQHQIEWLYMQEWYENFSIQEFGITRKDLLCSYFLATATIFEPERSKERTAWTKSKIISKMITSFSNQETTTLDHNLALLTAVRNNTNGLSATKSTKSEHGLLNNLLATLDQLLHGFDKYTKHQLKNAWGVWLTKLHEGEDNYSEAELLATTLIICAGHIAYKEDILSHHEYKTLSSLTNEICQQLQLIQNSKVLGNEDWETAKSSLKNMEFEQDMQTLVKFVLVESGGMDRNIKQTFLSVVKTFYYVAYNADEIIDMHIYKELYFPASKSELACLERAPVDVEFELAQCSFKFANLNLKIY
ncbi:Copal-8-ol diphosphate hydratase [Handroanthus impetiginosus]|uniref:Copal-8-ol diphosphate hydratase n=1 Tax=Handroanthus impetiginosus TaxID=429701 RepID=A0A2G9HJS0_9LAMI|nr:Copal-8-ol diphosphate hydratase [Handroanthus impetiginosus]